MEEGEERDEGVTDKGRVRSKGGRGREQCSFNLSFFSRPQTRPQMQYQQIQKNKTKRPKEEAANALLCNVTWLKIIFSWCTQ